MVALLALAILQNSAFQEPEPPRKTLSQQIFKTLTGKNGYEEYVFAAEMVYEPNTIYRTFGSPETYAQRNGISILAARKRYRQQVITPILNLIRAGNRKPVRDPREMMNYEVTFPELAQFKELSRLFCAESYLRFSEGDSEGGMQSLMDGLDFAHNISNRTIIAGLVGVSCEAILLAEVSKHLDQLSERDAAKVIAYCSDYLKRPNPAVSAIDSERESIESIWRGLESPQEFDYWMKALEGLSAEFDDEGNVIGENPYIQRLNQMNSVERQREVRKMRERSDENYERLKALYAGPMVFWGDERPSVGRIDSAEAIADSMMAIGAQFGSAMGKGALQIAILRAHCAVIQFQWRRGRLPNHIQEVADPRWAIDPATSAPFNYNIFPDGSYELYSSGIASMGRLDLVYKRPVPPEEPPEEK